VNLFFYSRKLISVCKERVHFANALFSQAESLRGLHRRIIAYGPPRKNEMFTLKISASPCMSMFSMYVCVYCTIAELASAARTVQSWEDCQVVILPVVWPVLNLHFFSAFLKIDLVTVSYFKKSRYFRHFPKYSAPYSAYHRYSFFLKSDLRITSPFKTTWIKYFQDRFHLGQFA